MTKLLDSKLKPPPIDAVFCLTSSPSSATSTVRACRLDPLSTHTAPPMNPAALSLKELRPISSANACSRTVTAPPFNASLPTNSFPPTRFNLDPVPCTSTDPPSSTQELSSIKHDSILSSAPEATAAAPPSKAEHCTKSTFFIVLRPRSPAKKIAPPCPEAEQESNRELEMSSVVFRVRMHPPSPSVIAPPTNSIPSMDTVPPTASKALPLPEQLNTDPCPTMWMWLCTLSAQNLPPQ
mmetsp:Transcript_28698/g.68044  ORF Transcript_28698/g.68044 Transcript_28698/m.68044 type:complete len:238 (-) Transcript_28698:305-1018(-)